MFKIKLFFIIFLIFESSNSQILNLDFELGNLIGWHSINENKYKISLDTIDFYSRSKGLKIANINTVSSKDFGGVSQSISVEESYKAKEIKFSGFIKTKDVATFAGLWLRLDDDKGNVLFFNNMLDKNISGTEDWKKYQITTRIPIETKNIVIGTILSYKGISWFDKLVLEIGGEEITGWILSDLTPSRSDVYWLNENIIPLSTSNPNSVHNSGLLSLSKLFNKSKIISLGEVTHGASSIFKMKHRIIKYLKNCCDYNIFSIEASMPEAYKINDHVLTGEGNPKQLISDMKFWTWNTTELLDLVRWMREYNCENKDKIQFTGFDMQFFEGEVEALLEFSKSIKSSYLSNRINELELLLYTIKGKKKRKKKYIDDKEKANKLITIIKKDIEKNYGFHMKAEWGKLNLNLINQYVNSTSYFDRDLFMSENIKWIVNQNPESKFILWSHNGHANEKEKSMGGYLNDFYGDDEYLSIGFLFYEGSYTAYNRQIGRLDSIKSQKPYIGSYEYFFNLANTPMFALDLRNLPQKNILNKQLFYRAVGSTKVHREFRISDLKNDFDIVVFIKKSYPSTLLKKLN